MEWLYAQGIPIEAQYLYRKGLELSRQGNDEGALKYFRQAVILAPQYGTAFFEMGNCLSRLGRHREAHERYEQASHIGSCPLP